MSCTSTPSPALSSSTASSGRCSTGKAGLDCSRVPHTWPFSHIVFETCSTGHRLNAEQAAEWRADQAACRTKALGILLLPPPPSTPQVCAGLQDAPGLCRGCELPRRAGAEAHPRLHQPDLYRHRRGGLLRCRDPSPAARRAAAPAPTAAATGDRRHRCRRQRWSNGCSAGDAADAAGDSRRHAMLPTRPHSRTLCTLTHTRTRCTLLPQAVWPWMSQTCSACPSREPTRSC